jgi:hypothetical protein
LLVLLQGTPSRRVCHASRGPNARLLELKPGIRPLDAGKSTDGYATETPTNVRHITLDRPPCLSIQVKESIHKNYIVPLSQPVNNQLSEIISSVPHADNFESTDCGRGGKFTKRRLSRNDHRFKRKVLAPWAVAVCRSAAVEAIECAGKKRRGCFAIFG